jgi:hypothetical protein
LRWRAPVARWAAWDALAADQAAPDVNFVEPMLRRRLSRLAKMSLRVAHDCVQDLPRVRLVFASRHGELTRTTAMLEDIADRSPLSPTAFSLSVLNASSGLFSILRTDTTPSTAISAAESSFGFGLLEAAIQFADDPETPVLFVYADEPLPLVYGVEQATTGPAHALALLLSGESTIRLECGLGPCDRPASSEPHSLAFMRSLGHSNAGEWIGSGNSWFWTAK